MRRHWRANGGYEAGVSLGTCSACGGRRLYVSRKAAKRARGTHPTPGRLSPYECPTGAGWHLGRQQAGDRVSSRGAAAELVGDAGRVTFHDLPATAYPFTASIRDAGSNEVLWQATVEGPGVVPVPGLGPRSVVVRIEYADGAVDEYIRREPA